VNTGGHVTDERASLRYSQEQAQGLARRLAETEAALAAMRGGLVDALLDPSGPLLLADAQRALRESEREFRAVFVGSSDALVVASKEGICLDANPAAHAIAHLPDGALTGASLREIFGLKGPNQPRSRESGGPEDQQSHHEITLPDDETRIIEYSMTPDVLPGKDLWIVRDITERKAAEDYRDMGREILQILNEPGELSDSLQRVVATLRRGTGFDAVGIRLQQGEDFPYAAEEGFPEGFLVTENTLIERDARGGVCRDLDGRVNLGCTCGLVVSGRTDPANPLFTPGGSAWTNDSFPILDIPPDEDPRHNPRNVCIHHGYASIALVPIRDLERIVGLIHLNDRRKGLLSPNMVELLEGVAAQVGTALMRKRAEQALAASEEHLRQSQKMEAVGQLAGGIAHDFNNLLTAILGYSDLILANGSSTVDEVRPDLEEIKRAGERASALTQQILAFSRRQPLRPQVVSLDEITTSMEPLLGRTIGEDIDLVVHVGPGPTLVEVDRHQFEQVIMNLVVNARDAMPSGGHLTVETANAELDEEFCRTHADTLPGSYVMLRVTDTGVGMGEDVKEHVFEPFFTTKAVGAGTGLGLATVYGIVKQSDGSIFVTSQPGKGSSFAVYLPRATQSDIPAETLIPPPVSAHGHETVMVVEDEEALRGLIDRILGQAGYRTLTFASAQKALEALEAGEQSADMLLTDVMLPGTLQGHDLARTVLALRPDLPVLYISGYSRDALVHAGRLDEGVNLLEKPFSPEVLATMVRTVLDRPRGSGGGPNRLHIPPLLPLFTGPGYAAVPPAGGACLGKTR
jgi:signal transduction histidine kinase/ActR/RegA family two-component response regulator